MEAFKREVIRMKDWFPLTSYEFYAYLTTGMVVLAAVDRVVLGSMLAEQTSWTVVGGVFWAAIAYLTGQILAIPASAIGEQVLARWWLRPPVDLLLGIKTPRWREHAVRWLFSAREYSPLPTAMSASVRRKIASALAVEVADVDGETAFQVAFPYARGVADTATRLDAFINQYGMCRNVSFASLIAAVLLAWHAGHGGDRIDRGLAVAALVLCVGLFGRFVKFYAAYSRDVFRTYEKCVPAPANVALGGAPSPPPTPSPPAALTTPTPVPPRV
jgi:hypothetical protein